jgi:predicted MFS family arabinose efflux permease
MNASVRFMVWGTQPLGAIAGGLVATAVGLRATLVVAAIGTFLAIGFVLTPRIRGIKEIPEQVQD